MTSFSMQHSFHADRFMSDDDLMTALHTPSSARSALKELGQRRSPQAFEVSRAFVVDPYLPLDIRTTAAIELGKQATLENQSALIQSLDENEPMLIKPVAIALGRIGDEVALARLDNIQISANHPATLSLQFAKSLISYRLRLNSHLIASPREMLSLNRSNGFVLPVEPLSASALVAIQSDIQRQLPAIEIADQGALQFTCRNNRYWIVLTKMLQNAMSQNMLQTQGAIAAIVLKAATCSSNRYSVYEYIFTNPSPTPHLALVGVRAAGVVTHGGELTLGDGESIFHLDAANTVHSPAIYLRGTLKGSKPKLQFEEFVVSRHRLATQQQPKVPQPAELKFK